MRGIIVEKFILQLLPLMKFGITIVKKILVNLCIEEEVLELNQIMLLYQIHKITSIQHQNGTILVGELHATVMVPSEVRPTAAAFDREAERDERVQHL